MSDCWKKLPRDVIKSRGPQGWYSARMLNLVQGHSTFWPCRSDEWDRGCQQAGSDLGLSTVFSLPHIQGLALGGLVPLPPVSPAWQDWALRVQHFPLSPCVCWDWVLGTRHHPSQPLIPRLGPETPHLYPFSSRFRNGAPPPPSLGFG